MLRITSVKMIVGLVILFVLNGCDDVGAQWNTAPTATSNSITTTADTAVAITLGGTDPDGDHLSFTLTGNPINGDISGMPPNLTYTPQSDFTGSDSLTFMVSDGTVNSDEAMVTVTVLDNVSLSVTAHSENSLMVTSLSFFHGEGFKVNP